MIEKEGSAKERLLSDLFSEHPDIVILATMDLLVDKVCSLPTPLGMDRVSFLFTLYNAYLGYLSFDVSELPVENPNSVGKTKLQDGAEARRRVKEKLQVTISDLEAEEAAIFLGKLIQAWLLNASKEYLQCGEICGEINEFVDNRADIIQKYQTNIPRLFELNF